MLTVQQLIDELSKIKDKTLSVVGSDDMGFPYPLITVKEKKTNEATTEGWEDLWPKDQMPEKIVEISFDPDYDVE